MARKGTGAAFTRYTGDGLVSKVVIVRDNGAGIRYKRAKGGRWHQLYVRQLKPEYRALAEREGTLAVYQALVARGPTSAHSTDPGCRWQHGEPERGARWVREVADVRASLGLTRVVGAEGGVYWE